jgi:hypothetical protein
MYRPRILKRRPPVDRRTLYVVRRAADGKGWQGPDIQRGDSFTNDPAYWHRFGSSTAATAAAEWHGYGPPGYAADPVRANTLPPRRHPRRRK